METMFMQNFGGKTKSIMVFFKVAYGEGIQQHTESLHSMLSLHI